jgi:hypothetical protein
MARSMTSRTAAKHPSRHLGAHKQQYASNAVLKALVNNSSWSHKPAFASGCAQGVTLLKTGKCLL